MTENKEFDVDGVSSAFPSLNMKILQILDRWEEKKNITSPSGALLDMFLQSCFSK